MCSIHVKDPAAAHSFYTGTLGFETLMAMPEYNLYIIKDPGSQGPRSHDPGSQDSAPQAPGSQNNGTGSSVGLLLEPSDNPIAAAYMNGLYESGLPAIVFGVPDVRAEHERLTAAGVRFQGEPSEDPSGISAVFDDGCGNYIQLHQD
jgi:catechol 2,3-dioxygenase-like lactoylglutathione lyase family enzyme